MKNLFSKLAFLLTPIVILIFAFLALSVKSIPATFVDVSGAYPIPTWSLPPTPIATQYSNPNYRPYKIRLSQIQSIPTWRLLPVTPPPFSYSYYIDHFTSSRLDDEVYDLGCEMGRKDLALSGNQDSFVYLDFGRPVWWNNQWEIQIMDGRTFVSLDEVKREAIQFARGYYVCAGSDHLTLAIGTSNFDNTEEDSPEDYVTFGHGQAWARMVLDTASYINSSPYKNYVTIVSASNMELGFNDPGSTRAWVSGVNSIFYSAQENSVYNLLYNIGNATGCSQDPFTTVQDWDTCGDGAYADWTADDIWYISQGCQSCGGAFPMIYSVGWENAVQWRRLGEYSYQVKQTPMPFKGELTQGEACLQKTRSPQPENPVLCETPAMAYQKLYSTLNNDPRTSQVIRWSSDMRWMPTPTNVP